MRNELVGCFASPTGKVYIGQSIDIEKRFKVYKRVKPCFAQKSLYNSFVKHGVAAHEFSILHELPYNVSDDILNTYEVLYISQFKSSGIKMLNMSNGGRGRACAVSNETKEKIRKAHKGRVFSEAHRENLRIVNTGKKLSEEHKEKIRQAGYNFKHTEESKRKIGEKSKLRSGHNNVNYGKPRSEETKRKQSEALKGKYAGEKASFFGKSHAEDTVLKMKQTALQKWSDPAYKEKMREVARERWRKQKAKS